MQVWQAALIALLLLTFVVLYLGSGFAQNLISFLNTQVPWLITYFSGAVISDCCN